MTYFSPALDPPLGGSGRKTTTLVRDHEYFIPTKFHQNPFSGSGEEVQNVKVYGQTDGRTDRRTDDDGRTDDGRCAMTIAHLSLWLRWAKIRTIFGTVKGWTRVGSWTGTLKNSMNLWRGRPTVLLSSSPVRLHKYAVTCITEISLIVTFVTNTHLLTFFNAFYFYRLYMFTGVCKSIG